ncbi:hypothetical protein EH223_19210 [candidate division KSB1 bacterium]|nr:hypothetical protein [candidate division KSB1 bacterium]RQW00324.1 MAG: hypothetical protein EH223_19210 [candidate division KSB1 bacterium]
MKLVFYISGHGYGHAVRDIEIIKSLLLQSHAEIFFRTQAPKWLFDPLLNERVQYHERELDFGVQQKNSFSADKLGTFQRYARLVENKDKLIEQECEFLSGIEPDIVLSDITPFAFDAADAHGVKAIAVANFSWDWIYAPYLKECPEYEWIIEDIKSSYGKAEQLWRIPFYGDMSAFPNRHNVPLVGRRSSKSLSEARARVGIPRHSKNKYVLLGLRSTDLEQVDWERVESLRHITFVAVSREVPLRNCLHIREDQLPFVDMLNACDAVLSKPGYSIVSEVISNRTPIIYVPRQDFVEDPVLIKGLEEYAVCEELPQSDFYAGQWAEAFDRLFAKPLEWKEIRVDGAEVIATKILERNNPH